VLSHVWYKIKEGGESKFTILPPNQNLLFHPTI